MSKKGIEVDEAKVELISNLSTPKCVRDIRSSWDMSHPDSRSDPIGESEPSSEHETIYWDSLPIFILFLFFYNNRYIYKRTTTGVVSIKIYTHILSLIYIYKTVLLHLQIRAQNLL